MLLVFGEKREFANNQVFYSGDPDVTTASREVKNMHATRTMVTGD